MNNSIDSTLINMKTEKNYILSKEEIESLNLYYVACTRAIKRLNNARHLRE